MGTNPPELPRFYATVDWDFFLPYTYDIAADWGHAELPIYYEAAWYGRFAIYPDDLERIFTPYPLYREFWEAVRTNAVAVSESHIAAFPLLRYIPRGSFVYVFDLHLDTWKRDVLDCSSWLWHLRKLRPDLEIAWVYPDFNPEFFRIFQIATGVSPYQLRIGMLPYSLFKQVKREFLLVHVCRSGARTPPWADQQFQEFLRLSGARVEYIEPLVPRKWVREEALGAKRKWEEEYRKLLEKAKLKGSEHIAHAIIAKLPVHPTSLILVRVRPGAPLLPEHLYYALEYLWIRGELSRIALGTLVLHIRVDDLAKLAVDGYTLGELCELKILESEAELKPRDILVLRSGTKETVGRPHLVRSTQPLEILAPSSPTEPSIWAKPVLSDAKAVIAAKGVVLDSKAVIRTRGQIVARSKLR